MKNRELIDMWAYENYEYERGHLVVCGVDEAGRGPLAGPVCAAAVILPRGLCIDGLDDSKKLSEKKREELYPVIVENALAYAVEFGSVDDIERYNILNATMRTMSKAVKALTLTPDIALIDGNKTPNIDIPAKAIVKGDSHSANIAAASILAKVTRDRLMYEYDAKYPHYGFAKHKGYGTAEHIAAIKEFGPCPIHRMSFISKFIV